MLPKEKRLNLKFEFVRVVKGRQLHTEHLKLYYIYDRSTQAKVGISIPRKMFNKAHDRNRARRIISAAVQRVYDNLPNDLSLVIMPKIGLLESTPSTLEKELLDSKDLYLSH
jgi:ribonuclease P protein component